MNYLVLIFVQLLFGLNFVASKWVVNIWSPIAFASWRFLISGLTLLILLKILKKKISLDKKSWMELIPLALFGLSLSQSLFLFGLSKTTAVNTSILASLIPVFVFLKSLLMSLCRPFCTLDFPF